MGIIVRDAIGQYHGGRTKNIFTSKFCKNHFSRFFNITISSTIANTSETYRSRSSSWDDHLNDNHIYSTTYQQQHGIINY